MSMYGVEVITRGNCMICGKELTEGLFLCKECEDKAKSRKRGSMTREELKTEVMRWTPALLGMGKECTDKTLEAQKAIVDMLEYQPQGDSISREVILNKIAEIDKLSKAGKTDEALALMKECFESLSPSSEWISVKDRLPELGQMVLVTYADGDVETNERMTLKNLEVWKYGNSVVAWMPLPSPYKGEEE